MLRASVLAGNQEHAVAMGHDADETRKHTRAHEDGRRSKAPRIYVFELEAKIAALLACHPTLTRAAMCEEAPIPPTSLARAIGQGNDKEGIKAGDGRLGHKHQERLGRVFRFPAVDVFEDGKIVTPMWPEWRDLAAPAGSKDRRDTAKAFAERYRLHLQAQGRPGPQVVGEEPPAQPRDADTAKDAARQLMPRIGPAGSPKVTNLTSTMRVASLAIDGGQWGFGTVGLAVTIACPPWHGFAVQRARVVMDPHPGRLSEQAERYWSEAREYTTEAYGRPGTAVVMLGYCTRLDPFWEVSGKNTPIGKFATGPEFAPLEGLSPGDRVTVTFGTWLGDVQDCEAVVEAADGDASFLTDGLARTAPSENTAMITDIEGKKRRLIALIRQTGLNSAPDGFTELVTCEIEIGGAS